MTRSGPRARRTAVVAPAKVNLGLRIVGRRADGYHLLESLFVPIDFADEVEVTLEPTPEGDGASTVTLALESEVEGVPAGGANLATRAAEAFLAAADWAGAVRPAVSLRLRKRVPAAAGLGGGSSDAGAVLRGLATLCPGAIRPERLAALALGLGADVPFFLDPRPGWVRGIGEQVEPVGPLPRFALLLAHPGIPLGTADVYRAYDALASALTGGGSPSTLPPPFGFAGQGAASIAPLLENDLEPAAIRLCPPVARLREQLRTRGALGVGLSGSGPTVFGVFEDADAAHDAAASWDLAKPAWCRVASPWTGAT